MDIHVGERVLHELRVVTGIGQPLERVEVDELAGRLLKAHLPAAPQA